MYQGNKKIDDIKHLYAKTKKIQILKTRQRTTGYIFLGLRKDKCSHPRPAPEFGLVVFKTNQRKLADYIILRKKKSRLGKTIQDAQTIPPTQYSWWAIVVELNTSNEHLPPLHATASPRGCRIRSRIPSPRDTEAEGGVADLGRRRWRPASLQQRGLRRQAIEHAGVVVLPDEPCDQYECMSQGLTQCKIRTPCYFLIMHVCKQAPHHRICHFSMRWFDAFSCI